MANVQHVARRIYSRHWISESENRTITGSHHWTPDQKTDVLLNVLESRIKMDPTVLNMFLDVLREMDAGHYAPLISTISKLTAIIMLI